MLTQRLYYTFKPYLPWGFRMALRRIAARRKRKNCLEVWPINEAAGKTPSGWPGWPNGKKFSLVLTHDVEGPEGFAKCRQLAELEMKLGFRSSFNFIPEGPYAVTADLRSWLIDNGFEVGVHDLEHDGRLFRSHASFKRKAKRINNYIQQWGAVGFRSGFMLRNLDWLHDLNIVYDASTFDTDPFEHQSDGVGTIFPFWISAPASAASTDSCLDGTNAASAFSRGGYVELPYSLPQDSTLFLVFRETTSEIWVKKTDWIASHGGMVLVNVHPDYLQFEGEAPSPKTFPVRFYAELLKHIKTNHEGSYWHTNPKEIARYFLQTSFCSAHVEQKTPSHINKN